MDMNNKIFCMIIIITGFFLSGCASTYTKRLSSSDFVLVEKRTTKMDQTTFIGITSNNAYLEYRNLLKSETIIYWTPISEFPRVTAKRLMEAKSPLPLGKNNQ